jgi:uncharacterized protein YbjQ (UPF0145 family)
MGFFDGEDDHDEDADAEQSLEQVEAGGIPTAAQARLREMRGEGMFTSTLGVAEFALLTELGPRPVAQLLGASVHRIGFQYLPAQAQWGGGVFCALDQVAGAWDDARKHAFARLTQEAALVGADAVVGVKLRRGEHDWARQTVDYVVSGTGIRTDRPETTEPPTLSDLSVQDYWKLRSTGWAPAGLVAATAVFFIAQSLAMQWSRRWSATRNQELTDYSSGFSAARKYAVRYLRSQAQAVRADGIVGVTLEHSVSKASLSVGYAEAQRSATLGPTTVAIGGSQASGRSSRDGIVVTIQAVGTAIRRAAPVNRQTPQVVLGLEALA